MALNLGVLYQETSQLLEQQAQIRQALKQMGAEEKIQVYAAVRRSLTQAAPWLIEQQVAKHVKRYDIYRRERPKQNAKPCS